MIKVYKKTPACLTQETEKISRNLRFIDVKQTDESVILNWPVSLGLQCLQLIVGSGGIKLRGAGNGMFLMGDHGLDQLHGTADSQIAGIQAEVITLHRSPLSRRIIFVIG